MSHAQSRDERRKQYEEQLEEMRSQESLAKKRQSERLRLKAQLDQEKELFDPETMKAVEHNNRGLELSREGKYLEAIAEKRKALAIRPDDDIIRTNLTIVSVNYSNDLINSGLLDDAVGLLTQLKEEDLADGSAHSNLADIYYEKGLWEKASKEAVEAIRLEPSDADKHAHLALIYLRQGQEQDDLSYYQKALQESRRAISLNPGLLKTRFSLAENVTVED